jgi:hypothetical protein
MPSGIPPDVTVVVNIVGSNSTMSADSNDTRRRFLWGAGFVGFVGRFGVGSVGVLDVLGGVGRRGVRGRCGRELGVGGRTCRMFSSSIVLDSCPESSCSPGDKVEGAEAAMVSEVICSTQEMEMQSGENSRSFLSSSQIKPINRSYSYFHQLNHAVSGMLKLHKARPPLPQVPLFPTST